jgi:hypothetical protein
MISPEMLEAYTSAALFFVEVPVEGVAVGVTVFVSGLAARAVVAMEAIISALATRPTTNFFNFIGLYLLSFRIFFMWYILISVQVPPH